jgi:putative FmdB family regulatory protein
MPIYIYRCTDEKCKHEQEEIRAIAEVYEPTYCEKCGSPAQNIIARPSKMVRGAGGWSTPG